MTNQTANSVWLPRLAGIALLLIAGLLYVVTLDNGLFPEELRGGDLITHQYAQVQARPSNAPGYPLYTMGGWLWFHGVRQLLRAFGDPLPNPIPILSAYSLIWALIALWLFYDIGCRVTRCGQRPHGNWPIAFLVALFYAVTYFFWYYATTTEQYSSAIAQTLAIVLLFLLWSERTDSLWLLFALAILCGLSLAHMLTVAFIVPPIVAAVLWIKPDLLRSPKAVIGSLVAALIPLLSYSFVYVRGAQHPEWWGSQEYTSASQWFWHFVSTSQGREELMWAFEPGRHFFGNGFPTLIGVELSWILVITGLIGIALLRKPVPFVLYASLAIYLVFTWMYRYGNWFQVILPAYSLLLLGVVAAGDRLQIMAAGSRGRDSAWPNRFRYWLMYAGPIVLLLIAVVWRFDASAARADSRNRSDDTALAQASVLLSAPLAENSPVFASVDNALALQYLTEIWGIRPDIRIVSSAEADTILQHQLVYSTWDAVDTLLDEVEGGETMTVTVVSPEWVVVGDNAASEWPVFAVDEDVEQFTDEISLAGYMLKQSDRLPSAAKTNNEEYVLSLYWRLLDGEWPEGVAISVRPTIDGAFIANPLEPSAVLQQDRQLPAQLQLGNLPAATSGIVYDPYRLHYPAAANDDQLGVAVLLYRASDEGFIDLGRIDIPVAGSED